MKAVTFGKALNEFGVWTYFTGYHASNSTAVYFEEGENYPLLKTSESIKLNSTPVKINTKAASNFIIKFVNPDNSDTLAVVITNGDYVSGLDSVNKYFSAEYSLSLSPIDGGYSIGNVYFARLASGKPLSWYSSEILNNLLIREGEIINTNSSFAYPNPFIYDKGNDGFIKIPLSGENTASVEMNVYSASMELIYSSSINVSAGKLVRWNARNNNNNRLASGVYIYAIKNGDETVTGKVVIFNE